MTHLIKEIILIKVEYLDQIIYRKKQPGIRYVQFPLEYIITFTYSDYTYEKYSKFVGDYIPNSSYKELPPNMMFDYFIKMGFQLVESGVDMELEMEHRCNFVMGIV